MEGGEALPGAFRSMAASERKQCKRLERLPTRRLAGPVWRAGREGAPLAGKPFGQVVGGADAGRDAETKPPGAGLEPCMLVGSGNLPGAGMIRFRKMTGSSSLAQSAVRLFLLSFVLLALLPCVSAQRVPDEIRVVVIEGEGAAHGPGERVERGAVVRVEDEQGRALEDATVVFSLPTWGASGEFANGSKTLTVTTGQDGQATADRFRTNRTSGKMQIYVTASYRGVRARAVIRQSVEGGSVAKASGGKGKTGIIIAVVAAAAAGGVLAATMGGGGGSTSPTPPGPTPPTPIGITPASPTVGPPPQ